MTEDNITLLFRSAPSMTAPGHFQTSRRDLSIVRFTPDSGSRVGPSE